MEELFTTDCDDHRIVENHSCGKPRRRAKTSMEAGLHQGDECWSHVDNHGKENSNQNGPKQETE